MGVRCARDESEIRMRPQGQALDPHMFESFLRAPSGHGPPPKEVKTLNWSETGQIASDVDKNWSRLRLCSRRF
jgi:hypothetical protein